MSDETKPADGPQLVTVEIKVNGRAVKGFPYRLFHDRAEVPPAAARELIEAFVRLQQDAAK